MESDMTAFSLDFAALFKALRVSPIPACASNSRLLACLSGDQADSWGRPGSYYDMATVALSRCVYEDAASNESYSDVRQFFTCGWGISFDNPADYSIVTVAQNGYDPNARQSMRLGKFLRRALSDIVSDSQIELILQRFLNENCPARTAESMTFTKGESRRDFESVYCAAVFKGPESADFNSLSGSCMQGSRKMISGEHPARAYAGDFYIFAAWHKESGGLMARVIVAKDGRAATPIYASAAYAGRALQRHVGAAMGRPMDEMTDDLSGYSMAAIETAPGSERYLMPYLDCRESLSFEGDSFSIGYGDIETSTEGYVSAQEQEYCGECDEYYDSDDVQYIEAAGHCVCDSCRRHNFSESDLTGEYYRDGDSEDYIDDCGRVKQAGPGELERDSNFVYVDSAYSYVHLDYTVTAEDGDLYTLDDVESGAIVECEGNYYLPDSAELKAAMLQSAITESAPDWLANPDSIPHGRMELDGQFDFDEELQLLAIAA
jgi:hypothetical protein